MLFHRDSWFSNVRGDLLAGLVVALALIPEAIAFSTIAGVDPKVGLYASFSIAVVTAFSIGLGLDIRTVGDMGALPDSLPVFLLPDLPLTFETLACSCW